MYGAHHQFIFQFMSIIHIVENFPISWKFKIELETKLFAVCKKTLQFKVDLHSVFIVTWPTAQLECSECNVQIVWQPKFSLVMSASENVKNACAPHSKSLVECECVRFIVGKVNVTHIHNYIYPSDGLFGFSSSAHHDSKSFVFFDFSTCLSNTQYQTHGISIQRFNRRNFFPLFLRHTQALFTSIQTDHCIIVVIFWLLYFDDIRVVWLTLLCLQHWRLFTFWFG